jgi:hypothetical protein
MTRPSLRATIWSRDGQSSRESHRISRGTLKKLDFSIFWGSGRKNLPYKGSNLTIGVERPTLHFTIVPCSGTGLLRIIFKFIVWLSEFNMGLTINWKTSKLIKRPQNLIKTGDRRAETWSFRPDSGSKRQKMAIDSAFENALNIWGVWVVDEFFFGVVQRFMVSRMIRWTFLSGQ